MEEQFNKEAKQGWRFAADVARNTDENASSKHTTGGVFEAIDSDFGAVFDKEAGAVLSIPGNEYRIAHAWVEVRGGLRVFAVYSWHSEGWTTGHDALMEAISTHG